MRKKKNSGEAAKITLALLTVLCIALMAVSVVNNSVTAPARNIAKVIVTPVERGISAFGGWLSGVTGNLSDATSLRAQNKELQSKVDSLTAENSQLVLDKEELNRLRKLLDLSKEYADYETIGAHVISKGNGNWFSTFTIDKGTEDGVKKDCNVMAGSGLVGIVTEVGANWATVRSIIDDNSNVSAMVSTTSDTCIIAGGLELIDSGVLNLVQLTDEDNKVHVGDKVVTSNISQKFLPGILIGYISELNNDPNNLTKSGQITPVVDFRHLQECLVILDMKQYVASPDDESGKVVDDISGGQVDDDQEENE